MFSSVRHISLLSLTYFLTLSTGVYRPQTPHVAAAHQNGVSGGQGCVSTMGVVILQSWYHRSDG